MVKRLLGISMGLFLTFFGSVGLASVTAEVLAPSSRPVRLFRHRLAEQAPNMLLALALPGGYALLTRSIRRQKGNVTEEVGL